MRRKGRIEQHGERETSVATGWTGVCGLDARLWLSTVVEASKVLRLGAPWCVLSAAKNEIGDPCRAGDAGRFIRGGCGGWGCCSEGRRRGRWQGADNARSRADQSINRATGGSEMPGPTRTGTKARSSGEDALVV